ncbi:MAG: GntR family transcriptional regulator [Sphingomonadales bacterium]
MPKKQTDDEIDDIQDAMARRAKGATMQERVYNELRRSLMTGVFVPGEKVSLRTLAEQIGTSMMPVREAINRLVAERAFEVLPNRQVKVPVMTAERFAEIAYWRTQLEAAAVRAACKNMTPAVIKKLEAINQRIINAAAKDRRDELLPNNYDFHFTIYRQAKSETLLPMIESLWLQEGPFTYYSIPSPKALWDASHHSDIIKALKKGDGEAAAKALVEDIQATSEYLKQGGYYEPPRVNRIVSA